MNTNFPHPFPANSQQSLPTPTPYLAILIPMLTSNHLYTTVSASARCLHCTITTFSIQSTAHRLAEVFIHQYNTDLRCTYISKTWWSWPELDSTGKCYSIYSEGPPRQYFHSTFIVSIVCPSIFRLSQYPQSVLSYGHCDGLRVLGETLGTMIACQ